MKPIDKPQLVKTLQSAKPADIEVVSIDGLNATSSKTAISRIEASIRSTRAAYMIIAVRLR